MVDLVTEGLSNPQIGARLYVSRRTIETHVAHIFHKLDISNRAQLAAAATTSRLEPSAELHRQEAGRSRPPTQ